MEKSGSLCRGKRRNPGRGCAKLEPSIRPKEAPRLETGFIQSAFRGIPRVQSFGFPGKGEGGGEAEGKGGQNHERAGKEKMVKTKGEPFWTAGGKEAVIEEKRGGTFEGAIAELSREGGEVESGTQRKPLRGGILWGWTRITPERGRAGREGNERSLQMEKGTLLP